MYNESYDLFNKYILKCKELIKKQIYTREDAKGINYSNNDDISKIVQNHRLEMIESKINHTMRMIEQILKVNSKMGFKINLSEVLKIAILYHDIGRFRQATWSNTFVDKVYIDNNTPFKNHGEDGYDIFINNDFKVIKEYIPVIGMSILHHLDHKSVKDLNYKFSDNFDKIDIDSILTGNFNLNEEEWHIASLIVQLVADIDKIDILYQHLSSTKVVKDYVEDKSMMSLDNISLKWNIDKLEIIKYNHIDEKEYVPKIIKIPIKNIDIKKLKVDEYYKQSFYYNNWPALSELREREDWNFVSAMYWKFGVFLNDIEFYINLEEIDESNLLSRIYTQIPEEYKCLFEELFSYSDEILIKKRLKDNKGKIYL